MHLSSNMRVLVINVARIGDTLLSTPVITALHQQLPEGAVDVVVHPGRKSVLEHLPGIRKLIGLTPKQLWWKRFFLKEKYDIAIVYGNDQSLLKLARKKATYTIGFKQNDEQSNRLLDCAVPKPNQLMHAVHERFLLLAPLDIQADKLGLSYVVTPREAAWAEQWLIRQGVHQGGLVGLQMASFPTKSYRDWPFERFSELVSGMLTRWPDLQFIVLGDKQSVQRAHDLSVAYPGKIISAAGKLSLRKSAAIMSRLSLYIGVDTGPTHLAGALKIPMVGMYHCYHRGEFLAPLQHSYLEVVEHPALIARREAPMAELSASLVINAVERLSHRLPVNHPMHPEQE